LSYLSSLPRKKNSGEEKYILNIFYQSELFRFADMRKFHFFVAVAQQQQPKQIHGGSGT